MQSQVPIKVLGPHNSEISSVVFSPDEKYVFAGTAGGSIHMWDLESQRIVLSLREHMNSCNTLAVPCGRGTSALVSGSQDTNVKMWDLRSGKSYCTFKEHNGIINSVCFAPSGQWIASGDDTGMIKVK
jgi:WD40 repeat protein